MSVLVTPSCAPSDAGRLAPPSDAGWSSPDGAGAVVSSAPPSVLSGGVWVGSLVTSGSEEPEPGVVGPSEPDSDAGAGTSASLGVRGSGIHRLRHRRVVRHDQQLRRVGGLRRRRRRRRCRGRAGVRIAYRWCAQVHRLAGGRLGQLQGQELLLLVELGLPFLTADGRDLGADGLQLTRRGDGVAGGERRTHDLQPALDLDLGLAPTRRARDRRSSGSPHSVSPGIASCEPSPTPLIVATMMAAAAASGARWRSRSARLRRVPTSSAFIPATTAATAVSRSTSSGIGSASISARQAASIATRRSSRRRRRSGSDLGPRSP